MGETRRSFLRALASLSAAVMVMPPRPTQDRPRKSMPTPPVAAGPSETAESPQNRRVPSFESLERRESEFRKHVNQLFVRVRELKEQVDGSQTTGTFSVNIYRETIEIEKLARQLKSEAKA